MAFWNLDPGVEHLNHGSFGATPIPVLEAQQRLRDEMEWNPVRFMLETYQPALERARARLADFLGADRAGLVFLNNATEGVNAVLRSLEERLEPGDEILITNHGYNACANAARVSAARRGASLGVVKIPLPIESPDQVFDAITARVSEQTRLLIVDHIASPTAVVFPVERLVRHLEPEVRILIDGAHAPGMVDVDLDRLGASYAVGNCHKWMCAAKGAGYLYAREDTRDGLTSAIVGHGYNDGWPGSGSHFHAQFDWVGTDDPTAWFTVPDAIDAMATTDSEGWPGVRRANHELMLGARDILLEALDMEAPVAPSMIGSMATLPLPDPDVPADNIFDPLMAELRERWSIEVPVFSWPEPSHRMIRISAQRYNTLDQYERLAQALMTELG